MVDLVVAAHGSFARVVVLYLVLLGGWGIAAGLRGKAPSGSYLGALVIAEGAALLQGLLGIANLFARPPQNTLHLLYGVALGGGAPRRAVRGAASRSCSASSRSSPPASAFGG